MQVVQLCQKAGLVKLGHVALDGTKMQANASKHKAMSYGRRKQEIARPEGEVGQLLAKAEAIDTEEGARYGASNRGEEVPEELRLRPQRREGIRHAQAALEAQAQREQGEEGAERDDTLESTGVDQPPEPDESAQRNFTDPDWRIMRDNSTKSFQQSYNCQAAAEQ